MVANDDPRRDVASSPSDPNPIPNPNPNASDDSIPNRSSTASSLGRSAVEFAEQSQKLSYQPPGEGNTSDIALEARFVTPHDPVIVTAEGHRLPGVPLTEAHKLNILKEELQTESENNVSSGSAGAGGQGHKVNDGAAASPLSAGEPSGSEQPHQQKQPSTVPVPTMQNGKSVQKSAEGSLRRAMPPSHTNPLFPPLPLYGPPSLMRDLQCLTFRVASFFLSLAFLGVIVLGALFTSVGPFLSRIWLTCTFRNPDASRPFYDEEVRRKNLRRELDRAWTKRRKSQENVRRGGGGGGGGREQEKDNEDPPPADSDGFVPTEGGPDAIVCDPAYYARRVGLDVEEFQVQTEDGFIIDLWHVYDPREYEELPPSERAHRGPDIFRDDAPDTPFPESRRRRRRKQPGGQGQQQQEQKPKFPVLLMHGLLQSAGAYCVNDDDSLAFYLCKAGYDVWLGNNRCGFSPRHVLLCYTDPRMWCWNIRQMGVFDLPALVSRVLRETGFPKVGLVAHSQGTTQTFVALAKEQRPDLGDKLTVFCALAPAAYAGPLIGKMYFKFMRVITPAMFRLMFGIHAFIPFMMTMHRLLPPRVYGWLGYKVFSFLFNWSDARWDRGLRDRMFQFAPVYVSAESMRWWLGRECFAKHKCILATKEEWRAEEREDNEEELHGGDTEKKKKKKKDRLPLRLPRLRADLDPDPDPGSTDRAAVARHARKPRGSTAWYDARAPPFALWVCGSDDLVDGERLLRRFDPARGREPHVRLVHSRVLPEFEHLDVIWAVDAVDRVFVEVKEVLWRTAGGEARRGCRVPKGCEGVEEWVPPEEQAGKAREGGEGEDDEGQSESQSQSESEGSDRVLAEEARRRSHESVRDKAGTHGHGSVRGAS
ncbi:uncharacterized protein E0L32_003460 [Thyridium curvatum]|uniref:Partial AB-hydrolase lipase domain-containing protein n=1 Tax=Thyridium curvatum TaxID=1093900 RepID=A0A507BJM9_9PEZI|nr:uncharacterized protein E0L32_003460 [Thyridium curvatum]TPX16898.1 hypothetical protein E0L32_003460 [Thyridium curvatum]